MECLEESIQVNVPVSVAYRQWMQFANLPLNMKDIAELDEVRSYERIEIDGKKETFKVVISEQIPNCRIAWNSATGIPNDGVVTFNPIDGNTTQIILKLSYEPDGVLEKAGTVLGFVSRRVKSDLQHFKDFVEAHEEISIIGKVAPAPTPLLKAAIILAGEIRAVKFNLNPRVAGFMVQRNYSFRTIRCE